jgi:hypothetical protein
LIYETLLTNSLGEVYWIAPPSIEDSSVKEITITITPLLDPIYENFKPYSIVVQTNLPMSLRKATEGYGYSLRQLANSILPGIEDPLFTRKLLEYL